MGPNRVPALGWGLRLPKQKPGWGLRGISPADTTLPLVHSIHLHAHEHANQGGWGMKGWVVLFSCNGVGALIKRVPGISLQFA